MRQHQLGPALWQLRQTEYHTTWRRISRWTSDTSPRCDCHPPAPDSPKRTSSQPAPKPLPFRYYPLHARRAAAARRAGGAHGWPRVFKLARNGDETAVCRRPKAVNACLLRPHPSSYTHGSIHRKQRLHIWPQCRAHSISWHVAIASLTLAGLSSPPARSLQSRCGRI